MRSWLFYLQSFYCVLTPSFQVLFSTYRSVSFNISFKKGCRVTNNEQQTLSVASEVVWRPGNWAWGFWAESCFFRCLETCSTASCRCWRDVASHVIALWVFSISFHCRVEDVISFPWSSEDFTISSRSARLTRSTLKRPCEDLMALGNLHFVFLYHSGMMYFKILNS